MNHSNLKKTRIIGLDIYRLIAIVLITNIHYFGYSHLISNQDLLPFNKLFVLVSTSFTPCFVDMFVVLTGYFLCSRENKTSRLVNLWFQAFIVGLLMLLICTIISPQSISLRSIVHTFFPISTFTYWYLIPYAFLFVLTPYINSILNMINRPRLLKTILLLGGVMCTIEIHPIVSLDWFIGNHMSIIWFIYIYIIGAYIGKYGFSLKSKTWLLIGLISMSLMLCIKVLNLQLPGEMRLNSFCSPLPLLLSLSLFYFLSHIRTIGKITDKIISSLSISSLCVYLVQEQDSFRALFWQNADVSSYAHSSF